MRAELLESLVEFAPDALLVVDAEGLIVYANSQAASLFGWSREALVGGPIERLLPERFRERHVQHRRRFGQNKRLRPMGAGLDLYGRRSDGVEFPVEISLSPLKAGGEGLTAAAIRDVTERKQGERELIAAREAADVARVAADRANQGKSRFLATASHDLRQPLQALAMLNGTLRRMRLGEQAESALVQQGQAIEAMSRLLNALLDITKLESNAVQPQISDFPIAELLDIVRSEFMQPAKEKDLELAVDRTHLYVHTDRSLLEQVLRNLVSNAIKYTRAGRVAIRCIEAGAFVRLEVADTGVGVPSDQIRLIFDEFFQVGVATNTTRDGYGLGLSIVQRIARLLGLRLDVQSTPGQGSVFSIELPRAGAGAGKASARGSAEPDVSRRAVSGRILLVEDHPGVLKATQLLLSLEGYAVVAAVSCAEAVERVRSDAQIDLLVTDYHLSGDETGVDVIAAVRDALGRKIPVVLITGDTSSAVRKLRGDPLLRFASKPIDADELLSVVGELLDRGG